MNYLVGIDEAGRGPLAGPVSVGFVCAPEDFDILSTFPGINDSKKLSEKARERLFDLLEEHVALGSLSYTVVLKEAAEIDARGIAVVIREAITEGLAKLLPNPNEGMVYLDGSLKAPPKYAQETIIKGDSLIPSIMLASVAAKVTRDRLMCALATTYPAYEFERHKGYGTALHMSLIRQHGPCSIHRKSFLHID